MVEVIMGCPWGGGACAVGFPGRCFGPFKRRRRSRSHFPPFGRGEEELARERHRAGLSATCGGSGVRRARGSQRDAPLSLPAPRVIPPPTLSSGVRGPPPARGSRPFLLFPAGCPAPHPGPARAESGSLRRPPRAWSPTMPGARPLPFGHLPPGTRGPPPCPVGALLPHRVPASRPPERWSLHAPSSPRLLRRT